MFYICMDCGELVNEQNACFNAKNLPDPLCQLCYIDLLEKRHDGGRVEKFSPKNEEEKLLCDIFGRGDTRNYRKGSSQRNIDWHNNRLQKQKNKIELD